MFELDIDRDDREVIKQFVKSDVGVFHEFDTHGDGGDVECVKRDVFVVGVEGFLEEGLIFFAHVVFFVAESG